jgi:far upstream element-binding protein
MVRNKPDNLDNQPNRPSLQVKEAEIIEQQSAARAPAAVPAAPGSDYSAQWAEYYRSIGKVKAAEAIEQQMRQKGGSVPPAAGPQVSNSRIES